MKELLVDLLKKRKVNKVFLIFTPREYFKKVWILQRRGKWSKETGGWLEITRSKH